MKTIIIEDRAGQRLDNFLFQVYRSTPNSHVYRMIRKGRIRINGKVCRDNTYKLSQMDVVMMPNPVNSVAHLTPHHELIEKVKAMIVDEGEDYWLLNKSPGICVHGSERDGFGIIEVLRHLFEHALLVHRIDRNTSGCLLVAKSYQALNQYQTYWREHSVIKTYHCISVGKWQVGERVRVDQPLLRVDGPKKVVVSAKGKSAVSEFHCIEAFSEQGLCEVIIKTGRTHQIRVHAASIGRPILGDGRYGVAKNPYIQHMFLHAIGLSIPGKNRHWRLPYTQEQQQCLKLFR